VNGPRIDYAHFAYKEEAIWPMMFTGISTSER